MRFLAFLSLLALFAVQIPVGRAACTLKESLERATTRNRTYRKGLSGSMKALNGSVREKITAGSKSLLKKLEILSSSTDPENAVWNKQVDKVLFDFQISNLERNGSYEFILYLRAKLLSKKEVKRFLKDPRKVITNFIRERPKRLLRGKIISPEHLPRDEGFANVLSIETFFEHYISEEKRRELKKIYGIESLQEFSELLGMLSPSGTRELLKSMMDGTSNFKNSYGILWWSQATDCAGATSKEVIEKLALNPKFYPTGMIRITINPQNLEKGGIKFHKPTAIDGLPYLEWNHSKIDHSFGLTEGNLDEAVSGPIPVSMISFLEYVP